MYYYLYKITSLIPDKPYYYIGIHKTRVLEDGYFGSGVALRDCIKKYGKENFRKDILGFYENYNQLCKAEEDAIQNSYVTDPWCLNLKQGGIGGELSSEVKKKISESHKRFRREHPEHVESFAGKKHSEEYKLRMAQLGRERMKGKAKGSNNSNYGHYWPLERKEKLSQKVKHKYIDLGYKNPMEGKHHTQEAKQKMSECAKLKPKILCSYCGKVFDPLNYKKWHGENCKMKNNGRRID